MPLISSAGEAGPMLKLNSREQLNWVFAKQGPYSHGTKGNNVRDSGLC